MVPHCCTTPFTRYVNSLSESTPALHIHATVGHICLQDVSEEATTAFEERHRDRRARCVVSYSRSCTFVERAHAFFPAKRNPHRRTHTTIRCRRGMSDRPQLHFLSTIPNDLGESVDDASVCDGAGSTNIPSLNLQKQMNHLATMSIESAQHSRGVVSCLKSELDEVQRIR